MKELKDFQYNQRLYIQRQSIFGDAYSLYSCTFEADKGQVPQMEKAKQYVTHWNEIRQQNMGLLFWGASGNGKTFTAACIANELIKQEKLFPPTIRMTTFGVILNKLPALSAVDKEYYLNDFKSCDLLILDDFGMERQTDYAREQVFGIIDGRYLAQKPLIVTTNLSLQEMKSATELSARRIYDRVLEQNTKINSRRPDCVTEIRIGNSVLVVSGFFKQNTTETAADKMAKVLQAQVATQKPAI